MEYNEITKTQFRDEYNVVKVLTDKLEIMEQLKTFNSKNQAVAFGIKKKPKVTLEDILKKVEDLAEAVSSMNTRLDGIDTRLDGIDTRLNGIDTRLDRIVELNYLKE